MTEEEAALLAELRAISNSSASASRFDEPDEGGDGSQINDIQPKKPQEPEPKPTPTRKPSSPPKKKSVVKLKPKSKIKVESPSPPATPQMKEQAPSFGGFNDPSAPKTFQGEFGGAAEDADLLAELRAISMKSSTNRFDTEDDEEEMNENHSANNNNNNAKEDINPKSSPKKQSPPKKKTTVSVKKENNEDEALPPWKRQGRRKSQVRSQNGGDEKTNNDDEKLPPWKRKNKTPKKNLNALDNVEIMVGKPKNIEAAPEVPEQVEPKPVSIPAPKSTFQGERGGAAEDAELLAELRAISNQSSSANRFEDNNDDGDGDDENNFGGKESIPSPTSTVKSTPTKPKRSPPKTSSKTKTENDASLPPWKRKNRIAKSNQSGTESVEVMTPPHSPTKKEIAAEVEDANEPAPQPSPTPVQPPTNTFINDGRSGKAEDAELLAELRAISMQSSSANRFDYDEDENNNSEMNSTTLEEKPAKKSPPKKTKAKASPRKKQDNEDNLPPWKRKIKAKSNGNSDPLDNVTVEVPSKSRNVNNDTLPQSPKQSSPPWKRKTKSSDKKENSNTGFKSSSLPNTFQGERGGAAEDADLLAALRAISNQSGSAGRFDTEEENNEQNEKEALPVITKESESFTPPWKRKEKNDTDEKTSIVKVKREKVSPNTTVIKAKPGSASSGFPTNNNFQGERGGAAEDAALLAELRAISQQSSAGRFQESDENGTERKADDSPSSPKRSTATRHSNTTPSQTYSQAKDYQMTPQKPTTSFPTSPAVVDAGNDEIIVTVETVRDALESKNWKFRKAAYELLAQLVNNFANNNDPKNEVSSDKILQSLDELVPAMMKESNAGALDAALRFALLYTDHCNGACIADQARNVSEALAVGPGLASARPSTSKLVKSLLLKTMEVGKDGVSSIHAVTESLLTHGLSSKKPKVVINSVQLVLDAAYGFGAASLPLANVTSNASKMLQHSNRSVREKAIEILAEICRAVGSKDPLEAILSDMRAAQVAELDKLLEDHADPRTPSIGLRHQSSGSSPVEDALAVLKAGTEEAAAEAFASRPAINIFNELRDTEYAAKMKELKWSEKAGALDILLDAGGKKPYKLEQPSNSVNYVPLISELKRLLNHTHFAVKSKSMNALGMLAEGVGESLFAHLRPLLLPIISLSKDKKLTGATENCADALFGNIVGFGHLMDKEDGLPSLMTAKGEKNPIVRKSALSYITRCVSRCENAGTRGKLSVKSAVDITRLATQKTNDSDVSVRNEAIALLKELLSVEDVEIKNSIIQLTTELESSNPRLYKTLFSNSAPASNSQRASKVPKPTEQKRSSSRGPRRPSSIPKIPKKSPSKSRSSSASRKTIPKRLPLKQASQGSTSADFVVPVDETTPEIEDAWSFLSSLNIKNWTAAEDEGGVVAGLKSSNWKFRKEAINTLTDFAQSDQVKSVAEKYPENVIVVVREHTKHFKDSNFNILKAAMELFLAILDMYESRAVPLDIWMTRQATGMSVEKIADKKFASVAPLLLTRLCELQLPEVVITISIEVVKSIKSPLQHEGLLIWTTRFCKDFGAKALGQSFPTCVDWLLKVCICHAISKHC